MGQYPHRRPGHHQDQPSGLRDRLQQDARRRRGAGRRRDRDHDRRRGDEEGRARDVADRLAAAGTRRRSARSSVIACHGAIEAAKMWALGRDARIVVERADRDPDRVGKRRRSGTSGSSRTCRRRPARPAVKSGTTDRVGAGRHGERGGGDASERREGRAVRFAAARAVAVVDLLERAADLVADGSTETASLRHGHAPPSGEVRWGALLSQARAPRTSRWGGLGFAVAWRHERSVGFVC